MCNWWIADSLRALTGSHDLDKWLAAHMGDIFDKLGMILDDEQRSERLILLQPVLTMTQVRDKHTRLFPARLYRRIG